MKKQYAILLKWGLLLGVSLSVIQLARKFSDGFDFYSFGPILDLINVLIFVVCIYLGIKEIKELFYENIISFSKAFIKGAAIVIVAFFIVFIYLNLHYGVFFKDQIQVVNVKRMTKMEERIKSDSIQKSEFITMLSLQKKLIQKEEDRIFNELKWDTLVTKAISTRIDTIINYYNYFMNNQKLSENSFKLGEFDQFARLTINDISRKYIAELDKTDSTLPYISTIILNGSAKFDSISVVKSRFEVEKTKIKLYTNSLSLATYFSSQVLIFGILFDIFVAMYVYRKKPKTNL
jgi:hypothetical protein